MGLGGIGTKVRFSVYGPWLLRGIPQRVFKGPWQLPGILPKKTRECQRRVSKHSPARTAYAGIRRRQDGERGICEGKLSTLQRVNQNELANTNAGVSRPGERKNSERGNKILSHKALLPKENTHTSGSEERTGLATINLA